MKAIQSYADDLSTKQLLQQIEQQATTSLTIERTHSETPIDSAVNTARSVTTQPHATPINTARSSHNPSTPAMSSMQSHQPRQEATPRYSFCELLIIYFVDVCLFFCNTCLIILSGLLRIVLR